MNLNPFATDEDDDSDDEDKDFTIGDLEVEEEGKGHLPPGTGLVGMEEPLLEGEDAHDKNVGIHHLAASSSSSSSLSSSAFQPAFLNQKDNETQWNASGVGSSTTDRSRMRAKFPLLWPFGAKVESLGGNNGNNRNHFRGASQDHADDNIFQSSEDSDSDEDNHEFGGEGQSDDAGGQRRLSVTTEAKRRTSLEDDDEDEVVHVAMAEVHAEADGKENDDGELVEIRHAEEK
jgi:hypothetical protein